MANTIPAECMLKCEQYNVTNVKLMWTVDVLYIE